MLGELGTYPATVFYKSAAFPLGRGLVFDIFLGSALTKPLVYGYLDGIPLVNSLNKYFDWSSIN